MDALSICECWTCLDLDKSPHLTVKPFSPFQVHLLGEGVSSEWDVRSAGKSKQRENIRSVLFWRCCSEPSEEMNGRESRKQRKSRNTSSKIRNREKCVSQTSFDC